ncbi:SCO2521 family protein [Couchioplanes caeruleus]|uniref:SCO2521 family protein n=1 Tax=Couchioplanes caeruleus TaxID=56438 RepID=UPI0020BFFAE1|nr:SCO2521 family protein [Couchioplanes caeruleus]UQU64039.1 SCO2521 family protein [Couchioplanes caeruleus]
MVILGEVHTGLLQSHSALETHQAARLLGLLPGHPAAVFERPMPFVQSPPVLTGVDCDLPATSGRPARVIGAVTGLATLTGGHVVQGSVHAEVVATERTHRLPWSHYLARPGRLDAVGRTPGPETVTAFLDGGDRGTLDLGAIAARIVDRLHQSDSLLRGSSLKAVRTRLRWAATLGQASDPARVEFRVEQGGLRTVLLRAVRLPAADLAAMCADIAVHDWLLTVLTDQVRKSALGVIDRRTAVRRLVPAIDHLLHLWMPAARLTGEALSVWQALEIRFSFSRQWEILVHRIRDQLSVDSVMALTAQNAGVR